MTFVLNHPGWLIAFGIIGGAICCFCIGLGIAIKAGVPT